MFDTATVPTDRFIEDPEGLIDNAGDFGGDIQIGDSYSRRFATKLDDGRYIVIDFNCYVASEDENRHDGDVVPKDAWVQTQVGYFVCTDPNDVGSTEQTSDYRYWDGTGQDMSTNEQARELCAALTTEDLNEAVNQMGA